MQMLTQSALQGILTNVLDYAMPAFAQVEYRLVGTGAALLHGVELPARDVDLLVKERAGVDLFASALSSHFTCLTPPTHLVEARQYYAAYEVNGFEVGASTVEVEADSDGIETFGPGPWQHFVLIPCGKYCIPTVALELRLTTELHRNRPDRYIPLIRHMQTHGCDLALVRRGMEAGGLPQALQKDILSQLKEVSAR